MVQGRAQVRVGVGDAVVPEDLRRPEPARVRLDGDVGEVPACRSEMSTSSPSSVSHIAPYSRSVSSIR